jgi:hypothetical protein
MLRLIKIVPDFSRIPIQQRTALEVTVLSDRKSAAAD